MSGGLMQLVAYGAQDIYLTGNPQITFWKVAYKRHTNFSMESIEQTFNGSADFGRKVTCTISRNGDLISRVYLQVTLPRVSGLSANQRFRWLNWLGHVLVKQVEVEIGGQRIDRHYGDWLHIWNELTQTAGHARGYASMVGNVPRLVQPCTGTAGEMPQTTLYIPLQFWFCRNPGLALPLIALQYHEVKINLEFRAANECYYSSSALSVTPALVAASLWVDYVYLDTDERRRFAQTSHEYLIEQLQFTGDESVNSTSNKIKLNLNHPVKELIWVVQPDAHIDASASDAYMGRQWFNFSDAFDVTPFSGIPQDSLGAGLTGESNNTLDAGLAVAASVGNVNVSNNIANLVYQPNLDALGGNNTFVSDASAAVGHQIGIASQNRLLDRGNNPVASAKLQLNGHDRFAERDGRYFNLVQPFQHHTNCPSVGINVYSFGLKPEEHQPSGTCNMSRIDNATLQLTLSSAAVANARSCKVRVYATNYNVLRIMSGMGGLAYSN